jgi:hypothetical protein
MSNPLTSVPKPNANVVEPELEVDDLLDGDSSASLLEIDAVDAELESGATDAEAIEQSVSSSNDEGSTNSGFSPVQRDGSKSRSGLIALVLAGLLLFSIAINLKQSRDVASLESRSAETEQALNAAVERIDFETARANGAEVALDRVDAAVDVVNEKVLGLKNALDGLREATVR